MQLKCTIPKKHDTFCLQTLEKPRSFWQRPAWKAFLAKLSRGLNDSCSFGLSATTSACVLLTSTDSYCKLYRHETLGMCFCISISISKYMYIYIYACMCTFTCKYMYIHIQVPLHRSMWGPSEYQTTRLHSKVTFPESPMSNVAYFMQYTHDQGYGPKMVQNPPYFPVCSLVPHWTLWVP